MGFPRQVKKFRLIVGQFFIVFAAAEGLGEVNMIEYRQSVGIQLRRSGA